VVDVAIPTFERWDAAGLPLGNEDRAAVTGRLGMDVGRGRTSRPGHGSERPSTSRALVQARGGSDVL